MKVSGGSASMLAGAGVPSNAGKVPTWFDMRCDGSGHGRCNLRPVAGEAGGKVMGPDKERGGRRVTWARHLRRVGAAKVGRIGQRESK